MYTKDMDDSVFTKIIKGEIPGEIVYQDDVCVLTPNIVGALLYILMLILFHYHELALHLSSAGNSTFYFINVEDALKSEE